MAGIFKFKQFSVDQSGCAMKINTDGVLLGAFAEAEHPKTILDIGTGTGVIAMMLAQRFPDADINAVEIDNAAAETAGRNFENSSFKNRLTVAQESFQQYFEKHQEKKYDLIVSNPPFYINSLESPGERINVAKHADEALFAELIGGMAKHFTTNGSCWLILPVQTAVLVKTLCGQCGLHLQRQINIHSFAGDAPHREVLAFGSYRTENIPEEFIIYDEPKKYTEAYKNKLKDFFIIF